MRSTLFCLWLLVPAVIAAYHFGPGQDRLLLDDAAAFLDGADAQVDARQYDAACESFDAALNRIPSANVVAIRRIRLERAKAQMLASRLPEAYDELYSLSEELAEDEDAPRDLVEETHEAMAGSQYYMTWLMRLEGRPRDDWEPVIEASRQNYRWLAERAEARAEGARGKQHREDIEAAIRLARMDPEELQALPIPTQCQKCNSGTYRCKGVGDRPKTGKPGGRGGSGGPPPDGSGA